MLPGDLLRNATHPENVKLTAVLLGKSGSISHLIVARRWRLGMNVRKFWKINGVGCALAGWLMLAAPCRAADMPDQAAVQTLMAGRKAFNQGSYDVAADRFREFLRGFGAHREAPAAHYGLGLALLWQGHADLNAIMSEFTVAVAAGKIPERPYALYYLAVVERMQADALAGKPEGLGKIKAAAEHFAEAAREFASRVRQNAADESLPEWSLRATLDHADALLRTQEKPGAKAAHEALTRVMQEGAARKSPLYPRALYLYGHAAFVLQDYVAAGRALAQLAPFSDPDFGLHARYLLARAHHLSGERPEAMAQYQAVQQAMEPARQRAAEALRDPALSRERRKHLERFVNGRPEFLDRATLYVGVLLAQAGKNAEAQEVLVKLIRSNPAEGMRHEAQLWQGVCQLQALNYNEAANLFEPLREHPVFGDQARWWAARARARAADPANSEAYRKALQASMGEFQKAAERAADLARNSDGEARLRRADILLDLGDTQQIAQQYPAAAQTYATVAAEYAAVAPERAEQALERQVTALQLAGDYANSDAAAARFKAAYSQSTLLPGVLFREAENAYLALLKRSAAANDPAHAGVIARYEQIVKRFPDFPYAHLARAGIGMCHYRQGKYAEAFAAFGAIPAADRTGELATVNYFMGDCLLRRLPADTDDALSASRLLDEAGRASRLLIAFAANNERHPQTGDAMLKTALCLQRIADVTADRLDRRKTLVQAKEMLDRCVHTLPVDNPGYATAVIERARALALLGDANGAINELRSDKLRNSPNAPLGALRLASLLRASGKAAEAAELMHKTLPVRHDLLKDKDRAAWVPALLYEQGLALKECGKTSEAEAAFDTIIREFAAAPEAVNALWRIAQCRREAIERQTLALRQLALKGGVKPEELQAARQALSESLKNLRAVLEAEASRAQALQKTGHAAKAQAAAHLLYEAAWGWRILAQAQIQTARADLQAKLLARLGARLPDRTTLQAPLIPLSQVPVQPDEQRVRAVYLLAIAAAPEAPLANVARVELAEYLAARGGHDAALELLTDAMERSPTDDLLNRIRIRLAASLLARGEPAGIKAALTHAQAVSKSFGSPFRGEGYFYLGEAHAALRDWTAAAEAYSNLRDNSSFANIPEISDRALMRLAHALHEAGKIDDARGTLENLIQRFPGNPWSDQARLQIALAHSARKNYDPAISMLTGITRRTVEPIAARAQLQIGLVYLEQQKHDLAAKAFLAAALTYDYPEYTAPALLEAGRAYIALQRPRDARKALQQVVQNARGTDWARTAEKLLKDLP